VSDDQRRLRRQQRETTDRFIAAVQDGSDRLDALAGEINRARELDGQVRDSLPTGEMGDTLREWLDSHDDVADELQAACDALQDVLSSGAAHAAATELYLHELNPQADDPRGQG
jgi:hypothetical protein